MKRTFIKPGIFLVLVTAMAFTSSCNKEADIHEADLIGVWAIGQATADAKVGPLSILQFLRTTLQLSEQEAQAYIDELISEYDYISGGTITFNADYSYQMLNGDFEENGTWELQGDKLYLTISGEDLDDEHLIIESLDGSSAFMVLEEDVEVDMNEDGSKDFTATIIIEVDLTKL
jgi:hypothetical protein